MSIEENLELSKANFPFRKVKSSNSSGVKFRQTKKREGTKKGSAVEVEHYGYDHVSLAFRELYETDSGRQGDRCVNRWTISTRESVALASILIHIAENYQRDSAEVPYGRIVDKELASFGSNWIDETYETIVARTEKRKARSHLYGLMRRCIETCEDDGLIECLLANLSGWAVHSGDEFAQQQAEKAIAQLGLIPDEILN